MSTPQQLEPTTGTLVLAQDTILQNRYRIVRQLGKGGMGAVYEAIDERLGVTVALKETLSAEAKIRKQFEQEARLLAGLQHPALPRVTDHFTEGNRAFLVMQFIAGVDLARIIYQQPGPFPRDRVVAWADQLLDALIYLHSQDRQVIHRDIKPHNLKLTTTGQIALLDFGLARAQPAKSSTESTSTSSAAFFGYTKQYAPLEQIQDLATGPQSDIYALGATLYHLLTGVKPADALVRAASLSNSEPDPLKPANTIYSGVGPEISAILSKAMAQNPKERYASASEFREALRRVGRRTIVPAESEPLRSNGKVLVRVLSEPCEDGTIFKTLPASDCKIYGPGLLASVILIVLTIAIASFYGYQHWSDWSVPAKVATPERPIAPPALSDATRKPDRIPSSNRGVASSSVKTFELGVRKGRLGEKHAAGADRDFRINSVKLAAPSTNQRSSYPRIETIKQIKTPSLRLPNAETGDPAGLPAQSRLPAYSPQGASMVHPRLPVSAPLSAPLQSWAWRAPDGSKTVKFSNGTLRVYFPGKTTSRSNHKQSP